MFLHFTVSSYNGLELAEARNETHKPNSFTDVAIHKRGKSMKAVYFYTHGGPEVLEFGEIEQPEPGSDEVQVRLRASALNHADLWTRRGWPGIKLQYPHILGSDGAGEISCVGEGVSDFVVGDRVVINASISCGQCSLCKSGKDNLCRDWHLLGESLRGTYAEYVVVPSRNVLKLPNDFDYQLAAAAGLVFHTSWHSMVTRGNVQEGETVLIIGASGGVNHASIQIAKYLGAKVIVVGSSAEKCKFAESMGADLLIDRSREENWSKSVYLANEKQGVDVVIDNVGAGTMPLSMRAARKGGRILTVGNTAGPTFEIDNRYIFGKHLTIIGSTMGTERDFNEVMNLVFQGSLKPALDQNYPLEDAAQAQIRLEAGKQLGKITLEI
jgi:NADPH:quinone reductase-like Zn-dependent oxidoreductase